MGVNMKVNWYRDLSLRWKLLGSFSLVAALGLIVALVLLSQLGSLNTDSQYLGLNQIPSVQVTESIDYLVADYRRSKLEAVVNTSASSVKQDLADAQSDATSINSLFAQYRKNDVSDAKDLTNLETVESDWKNYQAHAGALTAVAEASNPTSAEVDHAARITLPYYKQVHTGVAAWAAHNIKLANQTVAHDGSAYSSARALAIALIVVLVVLSLVIALLISRSIKRSVDAVLER